MTTIHVPDLVSKLDLLRQPCLDADGRPRAEPLAGDEAIAARWSAVAAPDSPGIRRPQLAEWSQRGQVPRWAADALLVLFGLHPGLGSAAATSPAGPDPYALLREPPGAFEARVRLAGGAAGHRLPGEDWDRFVRRRPALAFPAQDVLELLPMGPAAPQEPSDLPMVWAGTRVAMRFRLSPAVIELGTPRHVFVFQDVRIDDERRFVALLPFADTPGITWPAMPSNAPEITIPQDPSPTNCLLIPPNWGPVRRLFGIASCRPLDDELLREAREQGILSPARLDLLAARLDDGDVWARGSFAAWQSCYRVCVGAPAAAAPRRDA